MAIKVENIHGSVSIDCDSVDRAAARFNYVVKSGGVGCEGDGVDGIFIYNSYSCLTLRTCGVEGARWISQGGRLCSVVLSLSLFLVCCRRCNGVACSFKNMASASRVPRAAVVFVRLVTLTNSMTTS